MKQYYLNLNDNPFLYHRAVLDCFEGKWKRDDVLSHIEKQAGIPRHEILLDMLDTMDDKNAERQHGRVKIEAVDSCALALEETIECILDGRREDVDITPPKIRSRPDGMTGKQRDIALLCMSHQLVEHTVFILLEPLFKAKLYPTQHASIPEHGQTRLKNQVNKYLRKKSLNIKYACKTDMRHAYQSVKYKRVIKELKKDIPNATHIFKLLSFLGDIAPGGHLIIGGYLDAWLFNYMMSKVIKYAYSLGKTRRGKFIPYATRIVTFMDDMLILSSSYKSINFVIKKIKKFAYTELGMTLKITTGITKLLTIEEERARKKYDGAYRGCPVIDMAGFKIYRGHVAIRRRVFLRTRRQFLRAWRDFNTRGTFSIQRAKKLISYYGYVKQTNSQDFIEKYHVNEIMTVAKRIVLSHAYLANRKLKEKLNDIKERTIEFKARVSETGKFARWPAESYHFRKYFGNRKRRRNTVPV